MNSTLSEMEEWFGEPIRIVELWVCGSTVTTLTPMDGSFLQ